MTLDIIKAEINQKEMKITRPIKLQKESCSDGRYLWNGFIFRAWRFISKFILSYVINMIIRCNNNNQNRLEPFTNTSTWLDLFLVSLFVMSVVNSSRLRASVKRFGANICHLVATVVSSRWTPTQQSCRGLRVSKHRIFTLTQYAIGGFNGDSGN